jgi:ribose/xylose/arabinose/galactoside ABC-type transport system permease subunit
MSRLRGLLARNSVLVAGLVLCALFALLSDRFATASNLQNIAVQASAATIVAVGMTYVIMTAGIDLSVGATVFLTAAVATEGLARGLPPGAVFLLVPLAGALLGCFNGLWAGWAGINPLIVTLASLSLFRGLGGRITNLENVPLPDGARVLGISSVAGIPTPVIIAAAVVLVGHVAFKRTVFGRQVQAIGANRGAAEEVGLPVRSVIIGVYALTGLAAGIAALIIVGRLGAVQPTIGNGFELTVIAAVVLGGTSLAGGRGSILGSVLGALILVTVENGLILSAASPYFFDIVRASVLILAVVAEALRRREAAATLLRRERRQEVESV